MNQAQKMEAIGTLAGGVAHDFNNMLGIIIGHVEIAMMETDPANPLAQNLQQILKASHRSTDIVRQLLAISGVGTISIETGNAVFDESYCREHAGFVPGDFVLLAVSDTGTGMTPEIMEHLFDPFFTTKKVGRGTGLGLATVHGIVKQNNGFINVYSEPGHGTTFKIYLPKLEGEAMPPEKVDEKELPEGTETVLLVEDEEAFLNISRDILERQGYTVLPARTPGEALSLAARHAGEIHLLLTDVVMPEMNGRELMEKLHALRPAMKSLFMSGCTANVVAH